MARKHGSRSRRNKRKQKRGGRRGRVAPISVVYGDPDNLDCSCPICARHAAEGIPLNVIGPDGRMVQVVPEQKPLIEVTVCGSASTWPELSLEPMVLSIPVGCTVWDLLESLCFDDPALRVAFPPGALRAKLDGQLCHGDQVLCPGDSLQVFGERDAELSRELAGLFNPSSVVGD